MKNFNLHEDGFKYDTISSNSASEALKIAIGNVCRSNYNDTDGSLYIDIKVICVDDEADSESGTVILQEEEPNCVDVEHDWRQSYKLFGGLKENPGVFGNGGGVIINEVCVNCGCKKTTNTWAQRPDTGEQGFEEISYKENAFESSEFQ